MANSYNTDQRKWVIKQYWKLEIAEHMSTAWQEAFTLLHLHARQFVRNKLETACSECHATKSVRSKTSMTEENKMLVGMTFVNSPKKST